MFWIDADNAIDYLRQRGEVQSAEPCTVERLSGGVSNEVFYVSRPERVGGDFVLKQARPQLRVPDPWFCGVERIWREVEVLRCCQHLLDAGRRVPASDDAAVADNSNPRAITPGVLFEDRDNYAFGMTAAPRAHRVWKQVLLAGTVDPAIARQCGTLLGTLHAGSWQRADLAAQFADRSLFEQLRIDPYYRTVARNFPTDEPHLSSLCESLARHRLCLVHADFSPKNLLVYDGGLMMVDFETGHFGDPAFDLGFFLSHLVLKSYDRAPRSEPYLALTEQFWESYAEVLRPVAGTAAFAALEQRAARNFAGCAWARLDGKSRVEYLETSPWRESIRTLCRRLVADAPKLWSDVLVQIRRDQAAGPGP